MTQPSLAVGTELPPRSRTFRWADPLQSVRDGAGLGGLEYLRAIAAGALPQPPLGEAMGFRLLEVDEGRALFECDVAEHHYNLIGSVHGGFAATLIDSATGCAVMSMLAAGDAWTTVSLSVDYLAGLDTSVGRVTCEAAVVRVGRRLGIADASVRDARGRVYARGSTTCMIMRG